MKKLKGAFDVIFVVLDSLAPRSTDFFGFFDQDDLGPDGLGAGVAVIKGDKKEDGKAISTVGSLTIDIILV